LDERICEEREVNMKNRLVIKNLKVSVEGRVIVDDVSLAVGAGEIHILMGPNGSGKSTFAHAIMGLHKYNTSGRVLLNGEDISKLRINERARRGLFLAFQNPVEIDGVKNSNMVRQAMLARGENEEVGMFRKHFEETLIDTGLDTSFYGRFVNVGFSGGEKKKNEMAQLMMLSPKFAILDEIDSGLDIDSIRKTAGLINKVAEKGTGVLLITHSPAIIKYLSPKMVYILRKGRVVLDGGKEIVRKLESGGFEMLDGNKIAERGS